MTITYPRDFPLTSLQVSRCNFDVTPIGGVSRSAGGQVSFQETVGGALWELSLTTTMLNGDEFDALHAWALSVKAGRMFKAYDPRLLRNYPAVYGASYSSLTRAAGGAFDGTASVMAAGGETIDVGATSLGSGTLPAGYVLTVGDYISFAWLGGQMIVKAVETKTADSGGKITSLSVSPWLAAGGVVPVTAQLVNPYCLMKMVPGSWSAERPAGMHGQASFSAVQTLA